MDLELSDEQTWLGESSVSRDSAGRPASSSVSCGAGRSSGRVSKAHELPALDELCDEVARTLAPQRAEAIVHGDYRLDNTVLHPTAAGRIVAVLDWEMSTLGDPLCDLGTLLAYWSEDGDDAVLAAARVMAPVTAADGFPTRGDRRPSAPDGSCSASAERRSARQAPGGEPPVEERCAPVGSR